MVVKQPEPIIAYTWDVNVTTDTAKGPRLELMASGISGLTPAKLCKERSCISIEEGAYFTVPAHNFGQYSGLTFSVWFKPCAACGSNAKIFDFGNGFTDQNGQRIYISRNAATQGIKFVVVRGGQPEEFAVDEGVWVSNVWRHLMWTLSPASVPSAKWTVCIDGVRIGMKQALYVVNGDLHLNYIGKSNVATDGSYAGFLDSFLIFPEALNAMVVSDMMQVRFHRLCLVWFS